MRQQRGGNLYQIDAALIAGGDKSRQIADHPTAECQHHGIAADAIGDQHVEDAAGRGEALVLLTIRQDDFQQPLPFKALPDQRRVQRRDHRVADQHRVAARQLRRQPLAGAQQSGTDQDRIGALAQADRECLQILFQSAAGTGRGALQAQLVFLGNALGHRTYPSPVGGRAQVGYFPIQRLTRTHQLLEPQRRIGAVQQRPVTRAAGTLGLLCDRSLQIHHPTAAGQIAPIVRVQYRPAAGRQHDARPGAELGDHFALAAAETALPLALEDQRDIGAAALLDLVVTVMERIVEQPRQVSGHGGLARTHRTDEKDTVFAEHAVLRVARSPSYRADRWRSRATARSQFQQVVEVSAPPALVADENCLPVLSTLKYWQAPSAIWGDPATTVAMAV